MPYFISSLITCEILKGDKPASLPFQQAKIELIINLKTAKTYALSYGSAVTHATCWLGMPPEKERSR